MPASTDSGWYRSFTCDVKRKRMSKWFKNAIVYSLDVETFFDSNGDGVGDFKGLTKKLDYLAGLGITCIWLLPFYPSPNRDNGYDVKDYYNIDSRIGDLGDFVRFISKSKDLGIKVIVDLVVNHTSIEHPWFQDARRSRSSSYRDFYIWSDEPKPFKKEDLHFYGEENTMWTYDDAAGQYYLHRFYKEQPDLNINCAALRDELLKIIGFWLCLRVDGFRIDAAEILIEPYGIEKSNGRSHEDFLEQIRNFVASKNPDAVLLAEANVRPENFKTYFKGDRRMHMLFNFYLNQNLFLALSREDARIVQDALENLPARTSSQQWLNFLRHHDELTLKQLTEKEAEDVFQSFAPRKNMQIYQHGIRRRLAPMLSNNLSMLKMVYSLLFSLPGAVLIRYGDEIGMGDDLSQPGRQSVRTPMQWSHERNAAFSDGFEKDIVHPVIEDGEYAYEKINILTQQREPDSLLNFIERLISIRKKTPEIGLGRYSAIRVEARSLLVHQCIYETEHMVFVHNLSPQSLSLPVIDLVKDDRKVFELLCDSESIVDRELLILEGYGFMWLRIEPKN